MLGRGVDHFRALIMATVQIRHVFSHRFLWAGYLLGFALGGFFDGILLHQILQWHHLLSALQPEPSGDLRVQVMADGLFHLAMYVVAVAGLWMLYRSRNEFTDARADRNLVADLMIGFGAWHVVDALLSHWLLGLHRIRMDVPDPLTWDIAWLLIFGLVPLAAGLWMKRRYPRTVSLVERRSGRGGLALSLAALVLAAAAASALPPAGRDGLETVTVVLRPDVRPAEFLAALGESDARIVWSDAAGGVWVLAAPSGTSRLSLYGRGALYVSGTIFPGGCSSWLAT